MIKISPSTCASSPSDEREIKDEISELHLFTRPISRKTIEPSSFDFPVQAPMDVLFDKFGQIVATEALLGSKILKFSRFVVAESKQHEGRSNSRKKNHKLSDLVIPRLFSSHTKFPPIPFISSQVDTFFTTQKINQAFGLFLLMNLDLFQTPTMKPSPPLVPSRHRELLYPGQLRWT